MEPSPNSRRFSKRSLAAAALIAIVSGLLGYYAHRADVRTIIEPMDEIEEGLAHSAGFADRLHRRVAHIETTHIDLAGDVWDLPDLEPDPLHYGGGLGFWGDDLLVLHMSGALYYFDDENGLQRTAIRPPETGLAEFRTLAARDYPDRETGEDTVRFNGVVFIEEGEHRGLYNTYTHIDAARECYSTRVAWLPIPQDVTTVQEAAGESGAWQVVFETEPCLPFNAEGPLVIGYMAGGGFASASANVLVLGSGEYFGDGRSHPDTGAQSDESDYGKVITIDLAAGTATHRSLGHRNVQGLAFSGDGRLWAIEQGPQGGDELNLIEEGRNYGWPIETHGNYYTGEWDPEGSGQGRHTGFQQPVFSWLPSVGTSSLTVLQGFDPRWDEDMLIGSLSGGTLYRARVIESRLVLLEPIHIGESIRDVRQLDTSRIALWLDTNQLLILSAIQ